MKKLIFAVILYSLMVFPGCQVVGIDSIEDNPSAGGKTVTITANIAGSTDTKVSLTPDTDPEGHPIVKVDWKESGETFEVYGSSGTSSTFTQIAGTNQFEGTLPESTNGEYQAIYGNPNSLDEQNGGLGQSTANDSPVLMSAMFGSSSSSITFEHATAILKPTFKVDGDNINNTITQILMGNIAKSNSGNGYYVDEITITPADLENIYIHLLVFPQVYIADHEFTFTVTAGDKNYIGSLIIPTGMSIEAGKLYTATLNLTQKESQPSEVILSQSGAANCYIISQAGSYKFSTVKGNSNESVGAVASAEVLWESFGTDVTPNVGDLVKNAAYSDGYITFQTADTYAEGNAVIAAKDASGAILWSWHIWLTDQPEEQEYYNDVGTMMDRNLGATSATPGDVGALGLLYQWGRKDPFLGSSSISESVGAASTIAWPSAISSNASNGTIAYATAHPTTFILINEDNEDWHYRDASYSTNNVRWSTSSSSKSIYDPCPAGWRVPDGGGNGVWVIALGSLSITDDSLFDNSTRGMNLSGKFGEAGSIWYPASGYRISIFDGSLAKVGNNGRYWDTYPNGSYSCFLNFYDSGEVNTWSSTNRATGMSVRCLQE